nr:O-antigen ligase family protein [Micromonospora yangpuensis]
MPAAPWAQVGSTDDVPAGKPSGSRWQRPGIALLALLALLAAWQPSLVSHYGAVLAILVILVSGRRCVIRVPEVLALVLAAWAYLAVLWSTDATAAAWMAQLYATACLVFVATRMVVRTRTALFCVAYGGIAGTLITAGNLLTGGDPTQSLIRTSMVELSTRYVQDDSNINYTAYTLLGGMLLATLLLLLRPRTRVEQVGLVVALTVLGWAVLLAGTRGAVVGAFLGICYLLLSRFAPAGMRTAVLVVTPAAMLVISIGWYVRFTPELLWLDAVLGRPTGDLSGRMLLWPEALSSWASAPLLGIGPGMFVVTGRLHVGAHNLLLALGNDVGLIGVLLYLGIFIFALAGPLRHTVSASRRVACLLLVTQLPLWLTGHWETSPVALLTLGLVSMLPVALAHPAPVALTQPTPATGHAAPAGIRPAQRARS